MNDHLRLLPIFKIIFFKTSLACIVPIIPATVPKTPSYSQFKISSEIPSILEKNFLMQGVFLFLKSNVKICPSNLLIAPVTKNSFWKFYKNHLLKI